MGEFFGENNNSAEETLCVCGQGFRGSSFSLRLSDQS